MKKKKGTLFCSGCCPEGPVSLPVRHLFFLFFLLFLISFREKRKKGKKKEKDVLFDISSPLFFLVGVYTQHVPVSSIPTDIVGVGRLDYMPVLGLRCMCVCFPFSFLKENKEIKRKTHVAFIFSFTPHHLKYSSFLFLQYETPGRPGSPIHNT